MIYENSSISLVPRKCCRSRNYYGGAWRAIHRKYEDMWYSSKLRFFEILGPISIFGPFLASHISKFEKDYQLSCPLKTICDKPA